MKATIAKQISRISFLAAALILVSACGRYERLPVQTYYQEQSEKVLGDLARQVAAARYGVTSSGLRGATGFQDICIPGFTVNCGTAVPGNGPGTNMPGYPGTGGYPSAPYIQDNTQEVNQCLQGAQMVSMNGSNARKMAVPALAMLTQCLDRLLVQSSQQLYAFAFQQMGPQSQQYFQFLLDSRGVNNNPNGMGYNTFNDPLLLQYLFGMNGNGWGAGN